MWPNLQETIRLVTFAEKILNGKFHFFCSKRLVFYPSRAYSGVWTTSSLEKFKTLTGFFFNACQRCQWHRYSAFPNSPGSIHSFSTWYSTETLRSRVEKNVIFVLHSFSILTFSVYWDYTIKWVSPKQSYHFLLVPLLMF